MTKLRVAKSELTFISFLKDFWTFCHPHDLLTWFPSVSSSKHVTTSQGSGRSTSPDFLKNFYINLPSHCWSVVWCFQFFFSWNWKPELTRFLFLNLRAIIFEFEWQTKDFEQITDEYWFLKAPAGLLKFWFSEKLFRKLAKSLFICCKCFRQVRDLLGFRLVFTNCCCFSATAEELFSFYMLLFFWIHNL